MSIVFFNTQPGQLAAVDDKFIPASIQLAVQGWGDPIAIKALINRASLSARCNFQLMHSFGGDIHITVFGDRVGQFMLGGVAMPAACGNNSRQLGIEYIVQYYRQNRVSQSGVPVTITLGATESFRALLIGLDSGITNPELMQWQFNMSFILLPYSKPNRNLTNNPVSTPTTPAPATPAVQPRTVIAPPVRPAGPIHPENGFSFINSGPLLDLASARPS